MYSQIRMTGFAQTQSKLATTGSVNTAQTRTFRDDAKASSAQSTLCLRPDFPWPRHNGNRRFQRNVSHIRLRVYAGNSKIVKATAGQNRGQKKKKVCVKNRKTIIAKGEEWVHSSSFSPFPLPRLSLPDHLSSSRYILKRSLKQHLCCVDFPLIFWPLSAMPRSQFYSLRR